MKKRVITAKEIQQNFSAEEIKELAKQGYGIPYKILEFETEKYLAKFYQTDLLNSESNQVADLTDKATGFTITMFQSEIKNRYWLHNYPPTEAIVFDKGGIDYFKNADELLLDKVITRIWDEIKQNEIVKRSKGIALRKIMEHGVDVSP